MRTHGPAAQALAFALTSTALSGCDKVTPSELNPIPMNLKELSDGIAAEARNSNTAEMNPEFMKIRVKIESSKLTMNGTGKFKGLEAHVTDSYGAHATIRITNNSEIMAGNSTSAICTGEEMSDIISQAVGGEVDVLLSNRKMNWSNMSGWATNESNLVLCPMHVEIVNRNFH